MDDFILQFFINGFFHFRVGTMKDLTPWIMVCKEEEVPYKVFDPQNKIIESNT